MDKKSGEKVDVLDVQPTTTACEQIAATVIKRQLGLDETMLARSLPPIKISVEVSLCVIEYQASPAWVVLVFRKGCCEISQYVAPQRVRPQVEPYRQQCRPVRVVASLSRLFDTHSSGRTGSPNVAGSTMPLRTSSSVGSRSVSC